VFDDAYEALIIMSKPLGNPDPGIPSVFVSAKAGLVMRKLLVPGQTRVRLTPVGGGAWPERHPSGSPLVDPLSVDFSDRDRAGVWLCCIDGSRDSDALW
jgi:hypothetical protein